MVRGHVNTDDHNGRPLQILFMIQDEENQKEVTGNLNAYVEVLRTFVTRWNNGEQDTTGSDPTRPSQPCDVLLVMMIQHMSTLSGDLRDHISAKLASSQLWGQQPHSTHGNVHIYSVNDNVHDGYDGYFINRKKFTKYNTEVMRDAIKEAETHEYTQSTKH